MDVAAALVLGGWGCGALPPIDRQGEGAAVDLKE